MMDFISDLVISGTQNVFSSESHDEQFAVRLFYPYKFCVFSMMAEISSAFRRIDPSDLFSDNDSVPAFIAKRFPQTETGKRKNKDKKSPYPLKPQKILRVDFMPVHILENGNSP